MSSTMTKEQFYNIIEEWVSKPRDTWNHVTLVAYFYKKYKEKNGINFTPSSWRGNPASSKECRDIKKLFDLFSPNDYEELGKEKKLEVKSEIYNKIYNYINWMFDYKYRQADKSMAITTQFFLSPYNLNQFQIMYNNAMSKKKDLNKIDILLKWCKDELPDILDNHQIAKPDDLLLINKYADSYNLNDFSSERKVLKKAKELGLI